MPHVREQQHVTNRRQISEQHHQAVDADALARGRRQAVFERGDIVFVEVHGLFVARIFFLHLFAEALGLVFGVIQLGEDEGDLTAAYKELEAVGDTRVSVVAARERRHFGRIGRYESRIFEARLDGLLEDFDLYLAEPPTGLERNGEAFRDGARAREVFEVGRG